MAQFDLGQDILAYVLRRGGDVLPTETATTDADHLIDTKLQITESYWYICAMRPWRWARKAPAVQFSSAAQVTGSVTTIAGTTVTLSATIATSMADRKFVLDGEGIPHRISAHTAGSDTLTLVQSYAGEGTSGTFTIFQDELTVASDILAFPSIVELHSGDELRIIPEAEFRQRFPRNVAGTVSAQYATFISESKIRIAPWTSDVRLFECSYNYRPDPLTYDGAAGTDTPILPRDARAAIAHMALTKLLTDKRDARVAQAQAELDRCITLLEGKDFTFQRPRVWVPRGRRVTG